MGKYVEANVPKNFDVHVTHLHSGNSTRRQRKGHEYMTIAKLVDPMGRIVSMGVAQCSRKDSPSRKVGRSVAIGRALKAASIK